MVNICRFAFLFLGLLLFFVSLPSVSSAQPGGTEGRIVDSLFPAVGTDVPIPISGTLVTPHSSRSTAFSEGTDILRSGSDPLSFADPDDEHWYEAIPLGKRLTIGTIFAVVSSGSKIYVGGQFDEAGGKPAHNIACYDLTTGDWASLGSEGEEGVNGPVRALAAHDGKVYAGGAFTTAGGQTALYIAAWDEGAKTWSNVENGVGGASVRINSMVVDGEGNLYVGGLFSRAGVTTVSNLAVWNGTVWSDVRKGASGEIKSMTVSDSLLYIAGDFQSVGGSISSFAVAAWDRHTWRGFGNLISPAGVADIAVDSAGKVYVVGSFLAMTNGGNYLHGLVWDNDQWNAVPGLDDSSGITRLEGITATAGSVVVTGEFTRIGALPLNHIARWDGSRWTGLGDGIYYSTLLPSSPALEAIGDNIFIGGYFGRAGDKPANGIARWNGSAWESLGKGIAGGAPGIVRAVTTLPPNRIFLAGSFNYADGIYANNIIEWNGKEWRVPGEGFNNEVRTLVADKEGKLYAGGTFTRSGDKEIPAVAEWDGTTWMSMDNDLFYSVNKLRVYYSVDLYAAGTTLDGGAAVALFARGQERPWFVMGEEKVDPITLGGGYVADAQIYDFILSDSALFVGGEFESIGGGSVRADNIALWDGKEWRELGGGTESGPLTGTFIRDMELSGDDLFLSGYFGGRAGLRRWNLASETWRNDGLELSASVGVPYISDMISRRSEIFIAGNFSHIGSVPASNTAMWNGEEWESLGSGVDVPTVLGLGVFEQLLAASPTLSRAGDKNVNLVAQWLKGGLGVEEKERVRNDASLRLLQSPVVGSATFHLHLPRTGEVRIDLFTLTGEFVTTIAEGRFEGGEHRIEWEPDVDASGPFLYRMRTSGEVLAGTMLLLR